MAKPFGKVEREMIEIKNGSGDITIQLYGAVYNSNLLELYSIFGVEFVKYIDGDFALVLKDKGANITIVSVDAFASKPLWINSKLEVFDYPKPKTRKIPPNTAYCYNPDSCLDIAFSYKLYDWDLAQNVKTYDKWIEAFAEAIAKRTKDVADQLFIGLSSGYDSGAIACELKKQNIPFDAYTLQANENMDVVNARHLLHTHCDMLQLTESEYKQYQLWVIDEGVDYISTINRYADGEKIAEIDYDYRLDKASAGDAFICEFGARSGKSIMLSGQGSDEIISDYGWAGRQRYSQSQLGGYFPNNLSAVFPYGNFDKGTMDAYIAKTEFIGRLYGIEARYPYLDVDLVQEFLHLTSELKNIHYKAPLHEYFCRNNYPYDFQMKKGFRANCNLLPG
jgi:asparagine synthetase B (glutamine-hydrolysing)